jgi:hypothetical protein
MCAMTVITKPIPAWILRRTDPNRDKAVLEVSNPRSKYPIVDEYAKKSTMRATMATTMAIPPTTGNRKGPCFFRNGGTQSATSKKTGRNKARRRNGLAATLETPLPPRAASIPLTLVFNSSNEPVKNWAKYELETEPVNETVKNGKKKDTIITAQAAIMTITTNVPIPPPATGFFLAAAGFAGARFFAGVGFLLAVGVGFLVAVGVVFFVVGVVVVFFAIYNSKWCLAAYFCNGRKTRLFTVFDRLSLKS